jgi:hypothetical protein
MDSIISLQRVKSNISTIIGFIILSVAIIVGLYMLYIGKYLMGFLVISGSIILMFIIWLFNNLVQTNDTNALLNGVNTIGNFI